MKQLVFLFVAAQLSTAFAEPPLKDLVKSLTQNAAQSSVGCPQAGYQLFEDVESAVGKAATSAKTVSDLMSQAEPKRLELQNAVDHCGACHETNVVSPYTASGPAEVRADVTCPNPFVRNFQADLRNDDLQSFASDILRGKSDEGAKLASDCQGTCNYYIASAHTPLSGQTSRLNMSVMCGPPREGSLLLAPYSYKVGFIQQWTCTKP